MTDEAIREGFDSIRPGKDYDALYESARCRSMADWLVGMNASRAFTLRYNVLLSVGRVQTPTLTLLVKRRREIDNFKPEKYATLTANFGDYSGTWFKAGQENDTRIQPTERAEELKKAVQGKTAVVKTAETERKREAAPQLYDLTSLQRDANSLLGFTADKTLKLAQSLYEKHKALTYPRTDSRYLPPDMIPRVVETLNRLPAAYQPFVAQTMPEGKLRVSGRTVDASKVTDHHALIPTNRSVNPNSFDADEKKLYDLVARRTLAAFYPACEYDATRIVTEVEGNTFRTTGRVILNPGWHAVPVLEKPPVQKKKSGDEEEAAELPALKPGMTRRVESAKIAQRETKPPAEHTDASLLSGMEHAGREVEDEELARQMRGSGIGTPATRAAIIERLIHVGYARRKGKSILATEKGVQLIDIMPEELSSPATTGRWELALDKIAHNQQDSGEFMAGIRRLSAFLTEYAKTNDRPAAFPEEERRKGKSGGKSAGKPNKGLGIPCPLCGRGEVKESDKAFGCTRWREDCGFTIWKDALTRGGGPELNEKLMRLILEKKRVLGSTGVVELTQTHIAFYPTGSANATAIRSISKEK